MEDVNPVLGTGVPAADCAETLTFGKFGPVLFQGADIFPGSCCGHFFAPPLTGLILERM